MHMNISSVTICHSGSSSLSAPTSCSVAPTLKVISWSIMAAGAPAIASILQIAEKRKGKKCASQLINSQ